jgi:hypothetical protein
MVTCTAGVDHLHWCSLLLRPVAALLQQLLLWQCCMPRATALQAAAAFVLSTFMLCFALFYMYLQCMLSKVFCSSSANQV